MLNLVTLLIIDKSHVPIFVISSISVALLSESLFETLNCLIFVFVGLLLLSFIVKGDPFSAETNEPIKI